MLHQEQSIRRASWDDPNLPDDLLELWNTDGLDGTQIAARYGVGRSAVLGKIHRLRQSGMPFVARPTRPGKVKNKALANLARDRRAPPTIYRTFGLDEPTSDDDDTAPAARGKRVRLPEITSERTTARRQLEVLLDERAIYRTDTVRCVCGKPGSPHCAQHAALVARVLG